uniref:Palmitoyltransferase n=1 Tax=Photinus pyralis TaxID=7054 RepID=A0A1Y1L9P1_PHOPY
MTTDCKYQPVALDSSRSEDTLPGDMALDSSKHTTRKWEIFAGRNRFYCNGRLMTAPHCGVFILTICLITGTSLLFFTFDCRYLAENVTVAIPIIGVVLFLFTMSALLRTALSDPGIIPRATPEEAAYVEKQIEVTNSANSPTYRPPPRTKEVLIKGQTVKLKYCFTCKIFRPPRASHCSLCDNCVDRFDHHCPWVGNCVGRRNYRFFYMFIVSLAFLAVFIFACAVAHIILITREDRQFLDAVKDSPASVIVAVICFFSVWSILGLAGFHTYLTTSNQTTNEDIKGSFTSKRGQESFNPYSQGNVCLNCFHILCGPFTPSLIDRRGVVTDEYRLELSNAVITTDPALLKSYGTNLQQNGQAQMNASTEVPVLYRQTVENLGTYRPLQKPVYRTHYIVPSTNCATKKITPTQSHLLPYELPSDAGNSLIKSSSSLPRLKNYAIYDSSRENLYKNSDSSSSSPLRFDQPTTGPRTPPEKRYSANFGVRAPERKNRKPRPNSYVYENLHAAQDDLCSNNECNMSKVKVDKNVNFTNIKVDKFPTPAFSPLYIQENCD